MELGDEDPLAHHLEGREHRGPCGGGGHEAVDCEEVGEAEKFGSEEEGSQGVPDIRAGEGCEAGCEFLEEGEGGHFGSW